MYEIEKMPVEEIQSEDIETNLFLVTYKKQTIVDRQTFDFLSSPRRPTIKSV